MALASVILSREVWSACLVHALSTEVEEVMGLLLGDTCDESAQTGSLTAHIWAAVPQARVDRRKDRVETTPEQLAAAMAYAEDVSKQIGRKTRVIGWYHSHPHITVLPSHVDLRTQKSFQGFDPGFVGIIFSCFNEEPVSKMRRTQAIAFQSVSKASAGFEGNRQFASAQEAADPSSRTLISTMRLDRAFEGTGSFFPQQTGTLEELLSNGNLQSKMDDEHDIVQLSPGMQEAMHLSALDLNALEFTRKEVPLNIVPLAQMGLQISPPDPLVALQRTLFDEEKAAYLKAVSRSQKGQRIHPLAAVHHSATYQVALMKLLEFCLLPSMAALRDKLQENEAKLKKLQHEAQGWHLDSLARR